MNIFILGQFQRRPYRVAAVAAILLGLVTSCISAEPNTTVKPSHADIICDAAEEGKLAYKLTEPEEVKAMLGDALNERTEKDGGMEVLFIQYPDVQFIFSRKGAHSAPFTLVQITANGRMIDISEDRQITLRNQNDLKKLDTFWGLTDVSLVNLDLRSHKELLEEMPFDSLTKWPEPNKLPEGFDPSRLLEEGKNPGLGIRGLHKRGIDGRGVAIAILDQRLLKNHVEYADRIVRYEEIDLPYDQPLQMHGPPIVSIAVGKNCGVAPKADVFYYAMFMTTMPDNLIYCDIIDKIIKRNKRTSTSEKIRIVSISTGTFERQANFELWKRTLEKAKQNGILVVTCADDWLEYGMLERIPGTDPDDPNNYRSGNDELGGLLVPAGNRATASHCGPEVYTYWTEGGMSWAAPYLAGLAALAYQVDPEIKPDEIVKLWIETAVKTDAGSVVNPVGFIEAVQKGKLK